MDSKRTDYEDYWNELHTIQKETRHLDVDCDKRFREEGEDEAEWLRDVGLDHLTHSYDQGREITESDVNASIELLSKQQGEAVRRRVRSLNQTIRNRYHQQRSRHRKPDIRDLFKNVETSSTGTRSRSATPDSLDSGDEDASIGSHSAKCQADTETMAMASAGTVVQSAVLSSSELFGRRSGHWSMHRHVDVDVASDTEGIELVGYQRIGSQRAPLTATAALVTLSALRLQMSEADGGPVSFEGSFAVESRGQSRTQDGDVRRRRPDDHDNDVPSVSDADHRHLRPLLWLEVSSIFDKDSVRLDRRMPYKRKRKESGNVLGVSLSTLVMRDRRICADGSQVLVPQVFQMIVAQLEQRCCREEGILRVAGQKQKVEALCAQLEENFYERPEYVAQLLTHMTCHELTSLLKRLLRELPQPLLSTELIDLFYRSHELADLDGRCRALNLLVLLLPVEHGGTLKMLLSFLSNVVANQATNKMSLHNVAMIMAPSLFPPRHMQHDPMNMTNDLSGQVRIAAVCCRLVETLLHCGPNLWSIPPALWLQLQAARDRHTQKATRKKELRRSNTHCDSSSSRMSNDFSVVDLS